MDTPPKSARLLPTLALILSSFGLLITLEWIGSFLLRGVF